MDKFIFGRGGVLQDETDGETAGGGAAAADAGAAGGDIPGGGEAAGAGKGEAYPAGGDKGNDKAPVDMKAAIDQALGYKGGVDGKPVGDKPEEGKGGKLEGGGKESETHYANGKPKKNEHGEVLDPEGKVVKSAVPKLKSAAELDLKPEEKKALHSKTQARFAEVITTLKAHEQTLSKQAGEAKVLREGRDAILGVMKDTNTTQDQLSGYLYFNQLLQSGNPKDLESALQMVERQRLGLYKALGREPEGGGLDLLADFPDLKKQVEEEEITRAAALEISGARREKAGRDAAAQRQQQQQRTQHQSVEQNKQAGEKALKEIGEWTAGLAKTDLDYKAKEDKLLVKLDEVLKEYPPNKWLSTLKLLYDGIEITNAAPAGGSQNRPLRPSGAKPGAKAPASMLDAINQGLGYAGAEKG